MQKSSTAQETFYYIVALEVPDFEEAKKVISNIKQKYGVEERTAVREVFLAGR